MRSWNVFVLKYFAYIYLLCFFVLLENNVSSFLHVYKSYIQGSGAADDQSELCNCAPIIGAILQKVLISYKPHCFLLVPCSRWQV